jgi:signal transduction histidine kinase
MSVDAPKRTTRAFNAVTPEAAAALTRIGDTYVRQAAARILAQPDIWTTDALDADEFAGELVATARALEGDHIVSHSHESAALLALRRRILDLLQSEIVQAWSLAELPPGNAEILTTLVRFEKLRRRLSVGRYQQFASRLTGPDGLDLVVEVAHDLRSPLTSIMLLSETLRRGQSGEINDQQRSQLGIIYSAALALISMASDVIELARGGEALVDHEPVPFSLHEVLDSIRDMVQPMAEEKGVELRFVRSATHRRYGHPIPISRVLLNLTTNALKFSEEAVVEVGIQDVSRHRVEFYVRDYGRSIEPGVLETLFEPFRRSATESGFHFSGTGLGLSICRKLVEALGSELQVESRPDWGNRFSFQVNLPPAERA